MKILFSFVLTFILITFSQASNAVAFSLDMSCQLPLVGNTPMVLTGETTLPSEVTANEYFDPIELDLSTELPIYATNYFVLAGVDQVSITGKALVSFSTPELTKDIQISVSSNRTAIVSQQPATITASGVFGLPIRFNEGPVQAVLDDFAFTLKGFSRNEPATGLFSSFQAYCELEPHLLSEITVLEPEVPVVPQIASSTSELDLGILAAGTDSVETIIISNQGEGNLLINQITYSGDPDFSISENCLEYSPLALNDTCEIRVFYQAPASGIQTGAIRILSNDDTLPDLGVNLKAQVEQPEPLGPELTLDTNSLDFGALLAGQSKKLSVKVSNTGDAPFSLTEISLDNTTEFFAEENCFTASPILPNQDCSVDITFTAPASGLVNAQLTIKADLLTRVVALSGEATPAIGRIQTPSNIEFSELEQGASEQQTMVIENIGNGELSVQNLAVDNTDEFAVVENLCGSIAPNNQCTVIINFTPSASGQRSARLTITSSDPQHPVTTIELSGQGKDEVPPQSSIMLEHTITGLSVITAPEGEVSLKGTFAGTFRPDDGALEGSLALLSTKGKFKPLFSVLPTGASISFVSVKPLTGAIIDGQFEASTEVVMKLPLVYAKLFGFIQIPLGGGPSCQTQQTLTWQFSNKEESQFDPTTGGVVSASYNLGDLQNCGPFNRIISLFLKSQNNPIELSFKPAP